MNHQTGGAKRKDPSFPPAAEIGEHNGSVAAGLMIVERLKRGVNSIWQKREGDKPDQRQQENRRHQKQASGKALFEPYLRPEQKHHAYSGV